jgi:integrase
VPARKKTDGRTPDGKWIDRWFEGARKRQRTFDRKDDRDAFRAHRRRAEQLGHDLATELLLEDDLTLSEWCEESWARHAVSVARRSPGASDAFIIAMLAYAGLRPQELLALEWGDVLTDVAKLFITRKNVDGQVLPYLKSGRRHRNRRHRRVDFFEPLAADLRVHRMRSGARRGPVVARADGAPWRKHDWDNWRKRVWQPLAVDAGLGELVDQGRGRPARHEGADPYDLRGSFVSLLVWEGRTMLEVAAQAGHGVDVCEMYYARIFEGYDPARARRRRSWPLARPKDAPWTRSGVTARARERERGT